MSNSARSTRTSRRLIRCGEGFVEPLEVNLKLRVYHREFRIVPEEKRAELIEILDRMIDRLVKVINAKKTRTRVRLRAMSVLNDLIKTSYTMVRDVEVEHLEREIAEIESQAEGAPGEEEEQEAPSTEGQG